MQIRCTVDPCDDGLADSFEDAARHTLATGHNAWQFVGGSDRLWAITPDPLGGLVPGVNGWLPEDAR